MKSSTSIKNAAKISEKVFEELGQRSKNMDNADVVLKASEEMLKAAKHGNEDMMKTVMPWAIGGIAISAFTGNKISKITGSKIYGIGAGICTNWVISTILAHTISTKPAKNIENAMREIASKYDVDVSGIK